jgi:chemotaxis protein methyltransferase CheR
MRWGGFRKVRRQVCKRISRRISDLGLTDAEAYKSYLITNDHEWSTLATLCRVTISRFYRDRGVFDALRLHVLPRLAEAVAARGDDRVRCWCAGCASGEEPFTLAIIWWHDRFPAAMEITATDIDEGLLARAQAGRYESSSLKDLPIELREWAFSSDGGEYVIDDAIKRCVSFVRNDIRGEPPQGRFDIILCRNLAFTYFDDEGQRAVLEAIRRVLLPGGFLVVGVHEQLPTGAADFKPIDRQRTISQYDTPSGGRLA